MGIKGIYGEIGPGQRVALAKLATENYENTGRPLRIAVDVSIWQFQIQSGKGGTNPALRTLYYRLLRLLSLSIQPLFVFDGPMKPPFKRNKRTGAAGPSLTDFNTKQLFNFFGFPYHVAPGEAEAECALLQREGLVDAVLSEDVDTLMFGCHRTLRNWSSEGSRGNHAPTHVTLYDAAATKQGNSGLDREGMILVALMSGGDYITGGIPGCGIKVACEAAKAGFGKTLCGLSRTDTLGLNKWRENLAHELQTNESKHFRIRHRALKISENFPDKEALGYYTHPVVSSVSKLTKLREEINWDGVIDIAGLRLFVAEAFNWACRSGAIKFIRGLAPALLVSKVRTMENRWAFGFDDVVYTSTNEKGLVREICGRRQHFSTDGLQELRLVYHPANIVGLDLDVEIDDSEDYGRDGLAPTGEDQTLQVHHSENDSEDSLRTRSRSSMKRRSSNYDPNELQKVWVPETIAKVGIPLMVEDYEESLRNSRKLLRSKSTSKSVVTHSGMPYGALDRYMNMVKPSTETNSGLSQQKLSSARQDLSPPYLASVSNNSSPSRTLENPKCNEPEASLAEKITMKIDGKSTSMSKQSKPKAVTQKGLRHGNPWTIAQSSSPTSQRPHVSAIQITKPGLAEEESVATSDPLKTLIEVPDLRSYPDVSPPSPLGKHSRLISASSNTETPHSKISNLHSSKKKGISNISGKSAELTANARQFQKATHEVIEISSSPIAASPTSIASQTSRENSATKTVQRQLERVKKSRKGKTYVILRDSLEGAWKEVSQEPTSERFRGRAWRASGVEVLDMTEN